jgi:hypothetical protein
MSTHEHRARGLAALTGLAILWIILIWQTWSHTPFWPDAAGYTSHVAEGRWVAHPPGYPFFVALGHGFHALGFPPYPAVQAASLLLTLTALPVLFLLFRRTCRQIDAALLTIAFLFSWNVLLLSRTGTSHAADFFSVSFLLLITTSRGFREGKNFYLALYGLGIVACAGLRLTTAIMMVPFFALVLFRHRRMAGLWITYTLAGLAVFLLQILVIRLSGGWQPYSEYSHAMHLGNLGSSLLLSGVNGATLLNLTRTLGWWGLSVSFLLILPLIVPWKKSTGGTTSTSSVASKVTDGMEPVPPLQTMPGLTLNQRELLLYGGTSALGCLAMAGLYLCTHPGYLSAAMPGTFACLAAILPLIAHQAWKTGVVASCIVLDTGFFLLARPILHPSTPFQAAANGLLLQYSGDAVRQSLYKTTSGWLREAARDDLIPPHRRRDLDSEQSHH